MYYVILTMKSMTYAMKGQRLLSRFNINSRIVYLNPAQTKRGCAYGLEVNRQNLDQAIDILDKGKVKFSEVIKG